jgi:hypothetical protein
VDLTNNIRRELYRGKYVGTSSPGFAQIASLQSHLVSLSRGETFNSALRHNQFYVGAGAKMTFTRHFSLFRFQDFAARQANTPLPARAVINQ